MTKADFIREQVNIKRGKHVCAHFLNLRLCSHVCAQFSITIAHTTYVNTILHLRTLKKLYVNSTSSGSQI
jgi:hypothetical protein